MRIQNVQSPQFKGGWSLVGSEEDLGNICWYLQRKHMKSENYRFAAVRDSFIIPFRKKPGEHTDLFLTGEDSDILEPKLDRIIIDSQEDYLRKLPTNIKVRKALEFMNEVRQNFAQGKPIEGFRSDVFSSYLTQFFDMSNWNLQIKPAQKALEAIKSGSFEIVSGRYN